MVATRDRGVEQEIRTRIERWINVNQTYLARELGKKRRENIFLVAPDEAVAPFRISSARKKLKVAPSVLRTLVDRLNRLERQRDPHRSLLLSVFVFPVPDQFGHRPRLPGIPTSILDDSAFRLLAIQHVPF